MSRLVDYIWKENYFNFWESCLINTSNIYRLRWHSNVLWLSNVHWQYAVTLLLSGISLFSLSVTVFVSRCSVLYFSVHRYEEGSFWPHLPEGDSSAVGSGPGEGYNINVPWNKVKNSSLLMYKTHTQMCRVHQPVSSSLSFFIAVCVGVQIGMEDGDYISAFQRILLPVAYEVLSTLLKSLVYSRVARLSVYRFIIIYLLMLL